MTLREQVEEVVDAALSAAVADGSLPLEEVPAAALERPRDAANGDWASTVALRAAKHLGSVVLRAGLLRRQQDGEQRDWDARGRRECEAQRGLERQKHHVTVAPIDYA